MNLFWGIASILQTTLLPGLIFSLCYAPQKKWNSIIPASFILSIIFTYCLVFLLVFLNSYTALALRIIFFFELALLFFVVRKNYNSMSVPHNLSTGSSFPLRSLYSNFHTLCSNIAWIIFCLSIILVAFRFGEIFTGWDAVVSWNRWATDFYNIRIPMQTWNYPQLLPAIISVSYTMMGTNTLHFFAVGTWLLFFPVALLGLTNITSKDFSLATVSVGVTLTALFLNGNIGRVGYADFPTIAFTVLGISAFYAEKDANHSTSVWYLFGFTSAFALAAMTKQAGLIWFVFLPFLLIQYCKENKLPLRMSVSALIWFGLLVLPWYIYSRYRIYLNLDGSEISWVTQEIHGNKGILQRMLSAFGHWKIPFILFLLTLPCLRFKRTMYIAAAGIIYYLFWAAFLSYDIRNSSTALPILSMCSAFYIQRESYRYNDKAISLPSFLTAYIPQKHHILFLCLGCFVSLLAFSFFVSQPINNFMERQQLKKQISAGLGKSMNTLILENINRAPGLVLTDFQPLNYVPNFPSRLYRHATTLCQKPECLKTLHLEIIESLADYDRVYLLVPERAVRSFEKYFYEQRELVVAMLGEKNNNSFFSVTKNVNAK